MLLLLVKFLLLVFRIIMYKLNLTSLFNHLLLVLMFLLILLQQRQLKILILFFIQFIYLLQHILIRMLKLNIIVQVLPNIQLFKMDLLLNFNYCLTIVIYVGLIGDVITVVILKMNINSIKIYFNLKRGESLLFLKFFYLLFCYWVCFFYPE